MIYTKLKNYTLTLSMIWVLLVFHSCSDKRGDLTLWDYDRQLADTDRGLFVCRESERLQTSLYYLTPEYYAMKVGTSHGWSSQKIEKLKKEYSDKLIFLLEIKGKKGSTLPSLIETQGYGEYSDIIRHLQFSLHEDIRIYYQLDSQVVKEPLFVHFEHVPDTDKQHATIVFEGVNLNGLNTDTVSVLWFDKPFKQGPIAFRYALNDLREANSWHILNHK